jgi:N-acetylglutamate synthase-like GNAT family acetyltransferase
MYRDLLIPAEVARRSDLGAAHKLVLGEMMRRQGAGTHFIASFEQVAQAIGITRRHAIRIVEDLIGRPKASDAGSRRP